MCSVFNKKPILFRSPSRVRVKAQELRNLRDILVFFENVVEEQILLQNLCFLDKGG